MTKRFLITLTILFVVILSIATPLMAQGDRQTGDSRTPINRQQDNRAAVTYRNAQQLRSELNTLYDETEATLEFFNQYLIAQEGVKKMGYEDMEEALRHIAYLRTQIASYSDNTLLLMGDSFPDSAMMGRLVSILRKVRTDAAYQASLNRAEKWFNSGNNRVSNGESPAGVRSAPTAPAFTKAICDFSNLVNFPSAADIGIAKGVLLVIDVVVNSLNASLGNNIPNPFYIAAVIAKGVTEEILFGLESARDAGMWCQDLAFVMQDAMMKDALYIDAVLFPPSAGGFMEYLKDFIPAIITKAQEKGVPVNCANTRLAEANTSYNQGKWADAYKHYREAYTNIGAAACLP